MSALDLSAAAFLAEPLVQRVLGLLSEDGEEARVVGGAVRNHLMGLPDQGDIDIATTALPETIVKRAGAAGLKTVPTGIDHGTITIIGYHRVVEVTTLRVDVETDGRRAVVRFGRDWEADATRRDFTMNALSVDADGRLYDFVGGLGDIEARRVRFIGSAERRIEEDRLRVLRFFRFHAAFGEGAPDAEGLGAAIRARQDLTELSAERIGLEMRKLVVARRAADTIALMQESGILPLVAAGVADLAAFHRFVELFGKEGVPALRFAVIFAMVGEDIDRIARRFRLSGKERDRMVAALAAVPAARVGGPDEDRVQLYRIGREAFQDGLLYAAAKGFLAPEEARTRCDDASNWAIPEFPLSGRDVVEQGIGRGPLVGLVLRDLERWWIAQGFAPDVEALRRRLQMMVAAQQ
ncbi:CCA tRNA nucleotidyltransferase [Kaistia algarum]|uniref:CCA tRNA nucleotidyltransferase n=1 Tax=Kaistia algarum TaxID=2083279 RepID=UPI000CE736ED|nr:CCA tRNA nucleotidyltransferase [Kaistia algarum]MCX5515615.1 CCA tRNA nucleotidyltransferase [Kaistia algarum]PPE80994.1 CCA tRNA nucleotidyltransferase [Kaistia algarum]